MANAEAVKGDLMVSGQAAPPASPGDALTAKMNLARALSVSDLLPSAFRNKPANVMIVLLAAEAYDVPVYDALYGGIHVIDGKPTLSASLLNRLVHRAGHRLRVVIDGEGQSAVVTATLIRSDDPDHETVTRWTWKRAQAAGLTSKGVWKSYPEAMLASRAVTEVVRLAAPDAVFGVAYTPEEIGGDGEYGVAEASMPPAEIVERVDPDDEPVDAELVEEIEGQASLLTDEEDDE